MFEYGQKGLPHAFLIHAPELVERGGSHLVYDTCVGESAHKRYIKIAAKYSRTYANQNKSELHMLRFCQRQQLWCAVIELNEKIMKEDERDEEGSSSPQEDTDEVTVLEDNTMIFRDRNTLSGPLPYSRSWCNIGDVMEGVGHTPRVWGATLLSRDVLVSRDELLTLLRGKLDMSPTLSNNLVLAKELQWDFFGSYRVYVPETKSFRKFVGFNKRYPGRRDFVRPEGLYNGTCYLCQVRHHLSDISTFDWTYMLYIQHICCFCNTYVFKHRSTCLLKCPDLVPGLRYQRTYGMLILQV